MTFLVLTSAPSGASGVFAEWGIFYYWVQGKSNWWLSSMSQPHLSLLKKAMNAWIFMCFSSGKFQWFELLVHPNLSPLVLGIASIGLAAAYYSAGNGLSSFKNCLFPVLFFMRMTPLCTFSLALQQQYRYRIALCGLNMNIQLLPPVYDFLCLNARFLTQPPFPFARVFLIMIFSTPWHFVLPVFYKCD